VCYEDFRATYLSHVNGNQRWTKNAEFFISLWCTSYYYGIYIQEECYYSFIAPKQRVYACQECVYIDPIFYTMYVCI
jgi:hypothetical protein